MVNGFRTESGDLSDWDLQFCPIKPTSDKEKRVNVIIILDHEIRQIWF